MIACGKHPCCQTVTNRVALCRIGWAATRVCPADDSEQQLGSGDDAGVSSSEEDEGDDSELLGSEGSEEDSDDDGQQDAAAAAGLGLGANAAAAGAAEWGELQLQDAADGADKATAAANGAAELSRGDKKRLKAAKEAELRAAERARLAGTEAPESAAVYEQSLLSEPNSSFLWVKYMAFQLKLGEFDQSLTGYV
jgi:rRNA biogenesis protein RRP5